MSTVIPSIKQFLTWALAVIGPVVATLMKSLKVTCSSGASRFTNHAVRIITSASSPEYYSRRKHISAFFLGFLLGSFLYLTVHNFRYAWYYDNKVLPVVVNHVGQTRFTGRTTGHPVTLYTTTRGRSTSRRPARPLLTSGVTMLVHQAWPDTMVPESVSDWVRSWGHTHAHWRYMFWTELGVRQLVTNFYPDFGATYDNYTTAAHRAHVQRYLILHQHGGVYADLDMESLQPLDPLLNQYSCILSEEPPVHRAIIYNNTGPDVSNALMACRAKHPFLTFLINLLPSYKSRSRVESSVGSVFLSEALKLYRKSHNRAASNSVHVISAALLMPRHNVRLQPTLMQKCRNSTHLCIEGLELCKVLEASDYSSRLSKAAYTIRHWLDFQSSKIVNGLKTNIGTVLTAAQAITERPI